MHVCKSIGAYGCIYIFSYTNVCIHIHANTHMNASTCSQHKHIHAHNSRMCAHNKRTYVLTTQACTCLQLAPRTKISHIYIYTYIYIYVCVYIYRYTHTHYTHRHTYRHTDTNANAYKCSQRTKKRCCAPRKKPILHQSST